MTRHSRIGADSLPARLVLRSHLLFLGLAAAAIASALEGLGATGALGGWRMVFLPVTVLQVATPFLALAWIVALVRSALAPAAEGWGQGLAGPMAAMTPIFLGYLFALAGLGVAGAAVNLWSLAAAAPLEVLHRSLLAGWSELFYGATVGLLALTLPLLANARETA